MAQKEEAKTPAKKGGGLKKILLIVVGALVLVGGAVGATLFFTGALHQTAEAPREHKPAAKTAAKASGGHGGEAAAAPGQAAIYQPLDPPFIINFEDQGILRYLQIGFSVMSRDKMVIDAVNNNMPQIRNNLILLFGNQKVETLNSNEGKEKLRALALEQVQNILNQEIGEPGIEAIYYTAFVMQ
ncbi:MAG TPA: flagellar basal body-associated FliL family protein [Candidatus Competibacter sp.]|nr:flagellar basal body-associated protein FliL [Candidatus Competibacteraceae bacterium]HRE54317.1 flagellar basal body-associated FliL family protein [Candidatus Competibacter sp.]HUM93082.1 flagellar basal body-associated FliL family protein [Candidatus Competibacter sp.]